METKNNHLALTFLKNTCGDHGFEAIGAIDCDILGIVFELLLDEVMSQKDARAVEKGCPYVIDDLALGTQRLHRTPGVGSPAQDGNNKRRVVGATFLPSNLFQDHPDIVIVGSANGRNGV